MRQWRNVQLNRLITMCIAQFNIYLVDLVVAILPIRKPAIASHNLARFNPGINPGIKQTQSRNPGIGKMVRDCIPYILGRDVRIRFFLNFGSVF